MARRGHCLVRGDLSLKGPAVAEEALSGQCECVAVIGTFLIVLLREEKSSAEDITGCEQRRRLIRNKNAHREQCASIIFAEGK